MSYSGNSTPQNYNTGTDSNSPELKLYQAFIFSVPICFTFIVLFLFYLVYLRRGSSDLSSLGMRSSYLTGNSLSTAELGLSKELREMLPILVFKESFAVKDSLCSVCLADYQADDKLQLIPVCGHTFHMECIDLWLTSHTTCPLCRLTLIPTQSRQDQEEDPAPRLLSPDEGASSQPESLPVNHGNDSQEQQRDTTERDRDEESIKEMQEDEGNNIGTSNACCSCSTAG